jgi:hypothetical protein
VGLLFQGAGLKCLDRPGRPSGVAASLAPGDASGAPGSGGRHLGQLAHRRDGLLGDREPKFQPPKAIDGDPATAWQEGNDREKGEWIEVTFDAARADSLVIRNGYQASTALFKGNRRLKEVLVTVGSGDPIAVRLKDSTKPQTVDLGGVAGATSVRVTIVSTYAGQSTSVNGTPFDDAAVSEISVLGIPGG